MNPGNGGFTGVRGGSRGGGRVVGEKTEIPQANLFKTRDYPVLNDSRPIIGGLLARQYGLGPPHLNSLFPGAQASDLGLL